MEHVVRDDYDPRRTAEPRLERGEELLIKPVGRLDVEAEPRQIHLSGLKAIKRLEHILNLTAQIGSAH